MSKLEELIKQLCPNGVEYKTLDEIANYRRGSFPQPYGQANWYGGEGAMPFVQVADVKETFELVDETKQTISVLAQPKSVFVPKGTVLVTLQGTIGRVAITQYDSYVDRTLAIFESFKIDNINKKYFAYQLKAKFDVEKEHARGSTLKTITKEEFSKFKIPVPPLEVQCEIVRILDNFTLLTAELTAELTARKKQYEYYKQYCFDSIKKAPIKHITDIALVKARVGWQRLTRAEYLEQGEYCLITGTDFDMAGGINFKNCVYVTRERYDMDANIQVHKNDILITKDGTLGKVALLKEEPVKLTTLNSGVFRIHIKDTSVLPQYLYHFFTSKYFTDFVESVKTGSTIPHLTQQGLVSLDIPIPSLEEQERIVSILDRFDALCNDITIGLPAEIEARQKQYEYYRDKLLTFKEKTA